MKKKTVAEELDEFFSDDSSDDIVLYDLPKEKFHTKHPFLRKGEGKLASHKHGTTNFSLKRQKSLLLDKNKTQWQIASINKQKMEQNYVNDKKK